MDHGQCSTISRLITATTEAVSALPSNMTPEQREAKSSALWFDALDRLPAHDDDLLFLVTTDCTIRAARRGALPTGEGVDWEHSFLLNAACALPVTLLLTLCRGSAGGPFRVERRGAWRVYGTPSRMPEGRRIHSQSPESTYPIVFYNAFDALGEDIEIVMREGDLLCVELRIGEVETTSVQRGTPFQRCTTGRALFEGAVPFASLSAAWLARTPVLPSPDPPAAVVVPMCGPAGKGQAEVAVRAERHRSVLDKLRQKAPSVLLAHLNFVALHWRQIIDAVVQ